MSDTGRRIALFAALLVVAGATTADEPAPLGLPEAIRAALAHNPRQISQRLEVDKANAQQEAARGARWPVVDLGASATRYAYPTFVYAFRAPPPPFPPMDDVIYDYGVALRLPLYTGGRLSQAVTLADLGKEISLERERLGAQDLTYNVSSVYLKIEQLAALTQAYDARIASLEAQEKRIALLREVGRAPKLDQLKIHGLLTKARYERLQIENRRREAYTLLYQLMGMPRPEQEAPLVRYAASAAPGWTLDLLRETATQSRPELRIAERQTATSAAQEGIARGERLPALSVLGGYRERSGSDRQFYEDWNVGVQLSVPLVDGGVRRARVEEAVATRAQAEQALEQARLDAARQLQDAWDADHEAQARVQVTETSVEEAAEALAIEKLKYEQGVGTVTDLLNAETALLTAQADRLQARFDLITARLNLLRATGTLSPEQAAALVVPEPAAAEEGRTP